MKRTGTADVDDLKQRILSNPGLVLEDTDLMRALIEASDQAAGDNIVDLRGIAIDRLETRLERLEETHSDVIAAAYENLSGTKQIHRAVLKLMEPVTLKSFLTCLRDEMPEILRVEALQLLMETDTHPVAPVIRSLGSLITLVKPGFINEYLTRGREIPVRRITLHATLSGNTAVFHSSNHEIRSEACLTLDLGEKRPRGLLAIGSETAGYFDPSQGTDLLAFLADAVERSLRRLLP
ncbi:MAG: DUF484 family protein [Rhodobacter sp.]|nr:DUF484 family protein [Rhodobacter sp.]MCY4167732.1 DUF484 family protein [Rhodobacter sp.]MCY4241991.1 DUF484 family protein [Rhodobacter sp.]